MIIRWVEDADRSEVERISQRDSRPIPEGPLLGIEIGGRLAAITSTSTGDMVADPFMPTAEARAMLELRAAQLRRIDGRRPGLRLSLRRRAPASLAGSPPGAGGRLLTLRLSD